MSSYMKQGELLELFNIELERKNYFIKKINIEECLAYLKEKGKKKKKDDDEESTIEGFIEKILKIKEIKNNFEIVFEIDFKGF